MSSLRNVVKKHDSTVEEENLSVRQLQLAQQVWIQQAVWNKFASNERRLFSLEEVAQKATGLFTRRDVAQYILDITEQINQEANTSVQSDSQLRPLTAMMTTPSSATTDNPEGSCFVNSRKISPGSSRSQMCGSERDFKKHRFNPSAADRQCIWTEEEVSSRNSAGLNSVSATLRLCWVSPNITANFPTILRITLLYKQWKKPESKVGPQCARG